MIKYCERCGGAVSFRVPEGDNRERAVCDACGTVRYRNPLIVVGCIAARDCRILLCKRSIEPRYGYWTVPAGFMELGESLAEGAARETRRQLVLLHYCGKASTSPSLAARFSDSSRIVPWRPGWVATRSAAVSATWPRSIARGASLKLSTTRISRSALRR